MDPNKFLHLCTANDEDECQDQIVAILEGQPKTKMDALRILSRLHHRTEWSQRQDRKRLLHLNRDLIDPPIPSTYLDALERLSPLDQEIVRLHILNDIPLVEISVNVQIPYETLRRRLKTALKKLPALVQSG